MVGRRGPWARPVTPHISGPCVSVLKARVEVGVLETLEPLREKTHRKLRVDLASYTYQDCSPAMVLIIHFEGEVQEADHRSRTLLDYAPETTNTTITTTTNSTGISTTGFKGQGVGGFGHPFNTKDHQKPTPPAPSQYTGQYRALHTRLHCTGKIRSRKVPVLLGVLSERRPSGFSSTVDESLSLGGTMGSPTITLPIWLKTTTLGNSKLSKQCRCTDRVGLTKK